MSSPNPDDDWCDWCGEEIRGMPHRRGDQVFCTQDCVRKSRVGPLPTVVPLRPERAGEECD